MSITEKEIIEIATHKSGKEFYNFLNLLLKKINNQELKKIIAVKKEQIKAAKTEQERALRNLELKRTFKEYLRKQEIREYIKLCPGNQRSFIAV
ncbi:MAG: hypothetical protein ACYCSQ_00165 [bacterium]